MTYQIRSAEKNDLEQIIVLCQAHARYEQANYNPINKKEQLARMLFCENPQLFCLVVSVENKLIGYTSFSKECSTWNAAYYVHMDCLYLDENYRGFGIGEALIHKIIQFAKSIEAHHIEWQTPVFNTRAIKFYNRIGASSKEKLRFTLDL